MTIYNPVYLGRGVILKHYRNNVSDCGGWKEMPPVEENMNYDFNFQVHDYRGP